MTRTRIAVLALAVILIVAPRTIGADPAPADGTRHIRTTDRRLRRLVHDGTRASDTFRTLVDRLHRSDVVVYLECSGRPGWSGRLTFVSSVGGYRYLHVRVAYIRSSHLQIALIGHELQHAVEIADAPAVVDAPSLAREYQRIGFASTRQANAAGVAFDSEAAVRAGYRVLRELSGQENQPPASRLQLSAGEY